MSTPTKSDPRTEIQDEVRLEAANALRLRGLRWLTDPEAEACGIVGASRRQSVIFAAARVDQESLAWLRSNNTWTETLRIKALELAQSIEADLINAGHGQAVFFEVCGARAPEIVSLGARGLQITFSIGIWAHIGRRPYSTKAPPATPEEILYD